MAFRHIDVPYYSQWADHVHAQRICGLACLKSILHYWRLGTPTHAALLDLVSASGCYRYSLQIFKAERSHFASPDKAAGRPDEFAAAVVGSSTHYGTITVDDRSHTLTFSIEGASFPNWEGTQQVRSFELASGELTYRVKARSDGSVPVSTWKRLD